MNKYRLSVKRGILAVVCAAGMCGQLHAANWAYIENEEVKVGVDLDRGACIGYFSELSPVNNVLNNFDTGRFVQQSYYGDEDGSYWAGNPWRYNPVQGGGYLTSWPATTLEYTNSGDSIYARVRPRHWATGEELYNVVMEEWITLEGNVAHIRFKMTYNDNTMESFRDQEMPAVFTDYDFDQLAYYNGTSPWTGGALTHNNVAGSSPPTNVRDDYLTEHWAAYIKSSTQWGVGLYSPGSPALTYYRYSGGSGESRTSYFSPLQRFRLLNGRVVDYDVYLTIGTIGEIRDTFTGIHTNRPAEEWLFDANGDFEGWAQGWATSQITNLTVSGGALNGTSTGTDPYFHNQGVTLDGSQTESMLIKLQTSAASGSLALYWGDPTFAGFSGNRVISTALSGSTNPQLIRLPVGAHSNWDNHTITRLRLDPVSVGARDFSIDWIQLSEGDLDGDGIADTVEGLVDTDGDGLFDVEDLDSDNDGMSDEFEQTYSFDFQNAADALLDADSDGMNNLEEYITGTSPLDSNDWFRVDGTFNDPFFNISFTGITDRSYSLYRTTDLTLPWEEPVMSTTLTENIVVEYSDQVTSQGFYRVEASIPAPPPDTIIFQDTFDGSVVAWGVLNDNLAVRQAGGTTNSTYALSTGGVVGGDAVIFSDATLDSDFLMARVHNTSGIAASGIASVDVDTDFGPALVGQEWVLSFSQRRDGPGLGNGWSGFAVGVDNPPGTPYANGFGLIITGLGSWQAFNGTTLVGSGTLGHAAANRWYDITATFNEMAGTVSVDYTAAISGTIHLGTFPTSFGSGSTRFVGLRNYVTSLADGTWADMKTENLQIKVLAP